MADRDYDVGFGRPPHKTRFVPGRSGNPSGKRKPRASLAETLDRIFAEKVTVTEGGQKRKLTKEEVFLRQTVNKAMAGDRQFAAMMLAYLKLRGEAGGDHGSHERDAFLLDEFRRMLPAVDETA